MNKSRNSNVELLRVVGIILILLNHTLQNDLLPAAAFPWSVASSLFSRLGGLGDVIFFGITAYYLSLQWGVTLRGQLRRVWILEQQLLVYSIGLYCVTLLIRLTGAGFNSYDFNGLLSMGIESLLPLSSGFWWYPTSYAVFLVTLPFLNILLRCIGERAHGALAGMLFILCSISTQWGPLSLGWTPALFVYQYVVFSYVVWYLHLSRKILIRLVCVAALLGVIGPLISGVTGADVSGRYLNVPQSMPSMVVGFALVLLMISLPVRSSRIVNRVASCAFAAYLIQCYPSGSQVIGKAVGMVATLTGEQWPVRMLLEVLIALGVLMLAVLVDSVRQFVFTKTVGRHKGRVFDRVWELAVRSCPAIRHFGENEGACEQQGD